MVVVVVVVLVVVAAAVAACFLQQIPHIKLYDLYYLYRGV
jgi:hypothetical protein